MAKCLAFNKAILQSPLLFYKFINWFLDSDGNPTADFSKLILFDEDKKGWIAATDETNGEFELIKKIALSSVGGITQTSGALVTGRDYLIVHYITGDDFTNVGSTNADGEVFTASGTTPTTWTEGSTLQLLPQAGDHLIHDGTNWAPATPFFGPSTSGGTHPPAATAGGILSAPHGLGTTPKNYRAFLECTVADYNYAPGDLVDASSLIFHNTVSGEKVQAVSLFANSSLVGAVFRNGGANSTYKLNDKSSFDISGPTITVANWDVKFYAAL